jgi:hypothetical protein
MLQLDNDDMAACPVSFVRRVVIGSCFCEFGEGCGDGL